MAVLQMEGAIKSAQERVAEHGYRDTRLVSDRDVMLAGFGYMADRMENNTLHIRLEGKRFFAVGMMVGGIVIGVVQAFL